MAEILHVIKGAYVCLKYEAMIFDARGNGRGGISPTITGDHQNRITDYTAIVLAIHEADGQDVTMMEETAYALVTGGGKPGQGYPCVMIIDETDNADRKEIL